MSSPAALLSDVEQLRETFRHATPLTIGVEEEVMLLDPATLDLRPDAAEVIAAAGGDERFKTELPAAQLEIVLTPARSVADVTGQLRRARQDLARLAADHGALLAGLGAHPFAAASGQLNDGPRYAAIAEEFAGIAERQLVFGLHVHVAPRDPDEALAVFNALREQLPALAALAAGAPYHEGQDSGLASVRPKLNELLPRQGIPPELPTWEDVASMYAWGCRSGAVPDIGQWWWELRLHPVYGTLEVRVCDTQSSVADTAALVTVVQALVRLLADRHAAGELPRPAPTWRIAENRWSACRHGVEGRWFDVRSGATHAMRDHLHHLLDELAAHADGDLDAARDLIERPRASMRRALAREHGLPTLMRCLSGEFLG